MNIKGISKELSEELGIDPSLIEKVGMSEFKLVRESIVGNEWPCVYLQELGKFAVKPNRIRSIEEYERNK